MTSYTLYSIIEDSSYSTIEDGEDTELLWTSHSLRERRTRTSIFLSIYLHPLYIYLSSSSSIHLPTYLSSSFLQKSYYPSIHHHSSFFIYIYLYISISFFSIYLTSTVHLFFYLSNIHCTSIHLSICTPILLSIYITYFVHLPFYIYLSILLKHLFFYPSNLTSSVHLSFYKSIYYHLYIYSFIHLSIISSVHLSFYIYLSIIIYIYTYSIYLSYSIHLSLYDTLYSINLSL